jgi:hypothetical protein
MIERVARAIYVVDAQDTDGAGVYQRMARAAITAMREPTDAMLEFRLFFGSGEACQWAPLVWRAMIDEALEEEKQ